MRSPPPRVCCELATFAVLWKLARRHHQEITLSCSRQPRRRPQPAAHSELDTRMQHGRGPKHVACQVKHTHKKKKKKKELGASRSGPRRSFHPHGLDTRTTATPPVSPAPTLQVTRRTANFGAAETTRHRPSAQTACCALIVAAASLRTSPTTPRRVRRATPTLALTGCL